MHAHLGGRRRTNANNLLPTMVYQHVDFLPIILIEKLLQELSIQESQRANASICRAVPSTLGGWTLTSCGCGSGLALAPTSRTGRRAATPSR